MGRLENLKRTAGPGRTKGSKNKKTIERDAMAWAAEFFKSDEYLASATRRTLSGRAPHLEGYWLPRIHGKAPDKVEVSGDLHIHWQDTDDA